MTFLVENRKCSGSNHQVAKTRCPDRVKVSSFDVRAALGPGKSIRKRLNGIMVGLDGTKFGIFGGFHEISCLTLVMSLSLSGIIMDTQVMLSDAEATSLEVNF